MLMKAMVAASTFKDLLSSIRPDEVATVGLTSNSSGEQIPLVNANVSPDRFAEFAKKTDAEIVRESDDFLEFEHAIFIDAYSKTPEYVAENTVGLLGIWQNGGAGVA